MGDDWRAAGLLALMRSDHDALFGPPARRADRYRRLLTHPALRAAALLRVTAALPQWLAFLPRNLLLALHRIDCELPMRIGPGLRLPEPRGIICGRMDAGRDLTLHRDVIFGGARGDIPPLPVGDGVVVGARSTVLIDGPPVPAGTEIPPDHLIFRTVWVAPRTPGEAAPRVEADAPVHRLLHADYVAAAGPVRGLRGVVAMALRMLLNPSLHACVLLRLAGPSGFGPRGLWRRLLAAKHGIVVEEDVEICGGLDIPHPMEIRLGRGTRIGARATITHRVTCEAAVDGARVRIGDDVLIYPGARFRPGADVADRAVVGAYAEVSGTVHRGGIVRGRPLTDPQAVFPARAA